VDGKALALRLLAALGADAAGGAVAATGRRNEAVAAGARDRAAVA
jgi:hypothetical protein